MSTAQRIIKLCATAFAIILAVAIISGIVSVIYAVVNTVSGGTISVGHSDKQISKQTWTFSDVKSLDINHTIGNLKIMTGDTFKVEAENVPSDFRAELSNSGKLKVDENDHGIHFLWFDFNGFDNVNSKITIYVPADFIAENVKLDTGAGNVTIDGLQTDNLNISAGAGNITGSNMKANDMKIDGGVGDVQFNNSEFSDAEFDCGVGNVYMNGTLLGKTRLDCGVGGVELDLKGNVDDYGWDIDSGIGSVRLNGDKVSGKHQPENNTDNMIQVDGGVGEVRINIEE